MGVYATVQDLKQLQTEMRGCKTTVEIVKVEVDKYNQRVNYYQDEVKRLIDIVEDLRQQAVDESPFYQQMISSESNSGQRNSTRCTYQYKGIVYRQRDLVLACFRDYVVKFDSYDELENSFRILPISKVIKKKEEAERSEKKDKLYFTKDAIDLWGELYYVQKKWDQAYINKFIQVMSTKLDDPITIIKQEDDKQ